MNPSRSFALDHLVLLAFACSSSLVMAQTPPPSGITTPVTTTATPATASNPNSKLVASFTDLAGSKDNASSLVNGLRTGGAITLVDPLPPPVPQPLPAGSGSTKIAPVSTTFLPGTKPMGYGNIRIALSLARTQLASQGITNPTALQLQGALIGTPAGATGTATTGVLQMRASGMGWGQIANSMGVKLGAVMSGKQALPVASARPATGVTTAAGVSSTKANSSMTRGSGGGVVTGAGISGAGSAHGKSGVVTAAGGVAGGQAQVTTGLGGGHASTLGAEHSSSGKVSAGGGLSPGAGNGKGKP